MEEPLPEPGYGLPVEVEQGGGWILGWQFVEVDGQHLVFWQAAPGAPLHGWVEDARVRPRARVRADVRRTP